MAKRYLLLYQIKGDKVYVDAVVDCRQDYGWMLYLAMEPIPTK